MTDQYSVFSLVKMHFYFVLGKNNFIFYPFVSLLLMQKNVCTFSRTSCGHMKAVRIRWTASGRIRTRDSEVKKPRRRSFDRLQTPSPRLIPRYQTNAWPSRFPCCGKCFA